MSEKSKRLVAGGARAATGVAIIGVSVATAVALGAGVIPAPSIERVVVSVTVDTSQSSLTSLVCAGSFGELGADPSRPTQAIPSGDTVLAISGEVQGQRELSREQDGGSAPVSVSAATGEPIAAAESQQVYTPTLQGLVASACVEPNHEQWLVGGATAFGTSTTLVLGNPFDVAATVQITVFDENGQLDSASSAGVLVPAQSQRIVSMNGYAPARERLTVRVTSTGAAVSAALSVSQTIDIRSYAVDTVTRQLAPATTLVVPGVTNLSDHEHGSLGSPHPDDDFPVAVRVLAPGSSGGHATVRALRANGQAEELGEFEFEAGVVTDFSIAHWPEDADAVIVETDVPVVGGVFVSADAPPSHDYAWLAPAPLTAAGTGSGTGSGTETAVATPPGGQLVLVNPGAEDATVTVTELVETTRGEPRTVTVRAGAAVVTDVPARVVLSSTQPIAAGVRIASGANIAGFPVLPPSTQAQTLTVYPR